MMQLRLEGDEVILAGAQSLREALERPMLPSCASDSSGGREYRTRRTKIFPFFTSIDTRKRMA